MQRWRRGRGSSWGARLRAPPAPTTPTAALPPPTRRLPRPVRDTRTLTTLLAAKCPSDVTIAVGLDLLRVDSLGDVLVQAARSVRSRIGAGVGAPMRSLTTWLVPPAGGVSGSEDPFLGDPVATRTEAATGASDGSGTGGGSDCEHYRGNRYTVTHLLSTRYIVEVVQSPLRALCHWVHARSALVASATVPDGAPMRCRSRAGCCGGC